MDEINSLILNILPYGDAFMFVKKIISVDEQKIVTEVLYSSDSFFYSSHFKDNPVVPGVIITESIGQSALVAHVCYQMGIEKFSLNISDFYLSNIQVDFLKNPQFDKTYRVMGEKVFYRNNFFKSKAVLIDELGEILAHFTGTLKVFIV